jgi:hypothetical protein
MVTIPEPTPVTTPFEPIVARVTSLVLQLPPAVASLTVNVDPTHTFPVPVIAAGNGLTVSTDVDLQPVANRYVIVVVPEVTPETMPVDAPTEATVPLLLLHVPAVVASFKVTVEPIHT